MIYYLILIVGLGFLVGGGDLLVRGSVGLAEKMKIPPLIIGLTIVAMGTSAPELFISVQAALNNASGIAIGNVVGSNIANVLLVMGIPAMIAAFKCEEEGVGKSIVVMIGFTLVFIAMLFDGFITRFEGAILIALIITFILDQLRTANKSEHPHDYHDDVPTVPTSNKVISGLIVAGLVLLPLGAQLTVDSATHIAKQWNVSDAVIGLTIVAIGTSLPELATSVIATIRRNNSIAVGNVVGSNIFNIGSIMGITALISPMTVEPHFLKLDVWLMLATALLLAGLSFWMVKIGKRVGLAMLALYATYLVTTFSI